MRVGVRERFSIAIVHQRKAYRLSTTFNTHFYPYAKVMSVGDTYNANKGITMKKQSKAQARAKQSREQVQANKRITAVNADMRKGDTVMTLGEQLAILTDKYEQAFSKY